MGQLICDPEFIRELKLVIFHLHKSKYITAIVGVVQKSAAIAQQFIERFFKKNKRLINKVRKSLQNIFTYSMIGGLCNKLKQILGLSARKAEIEKYLQKNVNPENCLEKTPV